MAQVKDLTLDTTVDKTLVGLDQVDNTSDVNKPVSTAQQAALDAKLAANGNGSSLTGITASQISGLSGTWMKITKSFSDFAAASLVNTIIIATLPAKSVVSATIVNPIVALAGGLISGANLSIGMESNVDLMPASSVFATTTNPFASNLIAAGDIGATESITATLTALTGLLNTATAGSFDIYLLISTLP